MTSHFLFWAEMIIFVLWGKKGSNYSSYLNRSSLVFPNTHRSHGIRNSWNTQDHNHKIYSWNPFPHWCEIQHVGTTVKYFSISTLPSSADVQKLFFSPSLWLITLKKQMPCWQGVLVTGMPDHKLNSSLSTEVAFPTPIAPRIRAPGQY